LEAVVAMPPREEGGMVVSDSNPVEVAGAAGGFLGWARLMTGAEAALSQLSSAR
jgi:hypothetical protein